MYKVLIVFLLLLTGCGRSLSDKEIREIKATINLHNKTFGARILDSLIERKKELKKQYGYLGSLSAAEKADSIVLKERIEVYKNYSPATDPILSFDELIDYCKKNGLNPVEYAKTLASK